MTDAEFQSILNKLNEYLATNKTFISNPFRETEIKSAIEAARKLFPNATIALNDDPLQMGAMILTIEDFDITATGTEEINLFYDIVKLADNFEIYPVEKDKVHFAAVFQNVLIRI